MILEDKDLEVPGSALIKYGDSTVIVQHVDSGLWLSYKVCRFRFPIRVRQGRIVSISLSPFLLVTDVRDEEERSWESGGKAGYFTRGRKDGRRIGIFQVPGGRISNRQGDPEMWIYLQSVHQVRRPLKNALETR